MPGPISHFSWAYLVLSLSCFPLVVTCLTVYASCTCGAKNFPQCHQGDVSRGNLGSLSKRSRSPFDPTNLDLTSMNCIFLDMNPHSF